MKNLLERDKKRRTLFLVKELSRKALKYIFFNTELPLKARWAAGQLFADLPSQGSFARINARCVNTYRGRSVLKTFRFSRIVFREYARFGLITGVFKKSW
jgi:small subunit ribosomal protein S14